jgi:serine/threonine protein kinase/Tfp pilus assembly protein PilF
MALPINSGVSRGAVAGQGAVDSWVDSIRPGGAAAAFVALGAPGSELSWTDGQPLEFPQVRDTFLGFRLLAELGRGAFGRVYLARQDDLAQRLVALKVSSEIEAEIQNLAQLQHTHIMPIYSTHRAGRLQAVCMPYFGSATLADVLRDLFRAGSVSDGPVRPPASGKGLVSTIQDRGNRTRANLGKDSAGPGSVPAAPVAPSAQLAGQVPPATAGPPAADGLSNLRMLEGLTYVDAVLWLGERLADGLAHAHERGILHRDLKPANVLLTDDGQPMLLDFNLSTDLKNAVSRAHVGGTLPYMAPEHLAAFAQLAAPFPRGTALQSRPGTQDGGPAQADARSDVYALGVILYELLTGRPPFKQLPANAPDLVANMIRVRLCRPPRLRVFNRSVSPAVESIVQHCLESDPARRYQSAQQLADDLRRQRTHQPLLHAREKSLRERATKLLRRNHRRAVMAGAAFAALLVLSLTAGLVVHTQRLGRLEAAATLSGFLEEGDEARLLLAGRPEDTEQRREGLAAAHRALARYHIPERADWHDQAAVRRLNPDDRRRLAQTVGELLLLTAAAEQTGQKELIDRAAAAFPADEAPRALYVHRAELAERLGDREEARTWRQRSETVPVRGVMDHYLLARDAFAAGQDEKAIKHLRAAVRLDPKHFSAWYLLGNCYLDGAAASSLREAASCYTICQALRPRFYGSYYNRGLTQLRQNLSAEAEDDFSAVLELRPRHWGAFLHRGLAREARGKLREALADLDQAISGGGASGHAYLARARLRQRLGDLTGARHDEQLGVNSPPQDAESYLHRGVTRVTSDPEGAVEDFRQVVRLNPRSLPGLYNQALILADRMGQMQQAVDLLDLVVQRYPNLPAARASRGIFRARLGQRDAAHEDGWQAARLSPTGEVFYRQACIYALTSRSHPDDRNEAFRLLALALRRGFGHAWLEREPDLEPLRTDPRYHELIRAVQTFEAHDLHGR